MCGAPGKRPEEWPITIHAAFGRYLMRDRLIYSGSSNSDWSFWGSWKPWRNLDPAVYGRCNYEAYCTTTGLCDHGTEREAFLLGTKIETSWASYAGGGWGGVNPFLNRIVALRREVRWWDRRPVYNDTKGLNLAAIPSSAKVEVRRFIDRDGVDLLAIWNGTGTAGLSLVLGGRTVGIPSQELSILDLETRPPLVSAVVVTGATPTGATVSWTTDEPANSLVEFGTTTEYGSTAAQLAFVTSHSVVLPDLVADTLYHYRVRSTDRNGNASVFTQDATFSTPTDPDTTPPSTPEHLRRISGP